MESIKVAGVVWMTGLSGCGKSTLAEGLRKRLADCGVVAAVLDGDELRQGLNRELGFSEADRRENIRRIAEIARLLSRQGIVVIVSVISPYRSHRALARGIIGAAYREVHVDAPLAVCEARDVKGLYARARRGEVARFTGVSDVYEAPAQPSLRIDTSQVSPESGVERLLSLVERFACSSLAAQETPA